MTTTDEGATLRRCLECGRARPAGYGETCGGSYCQQARYVKGELARLGREARRRRGAGRRAVEARIAERTAVLQGLEAIIAGGDTGERRG